MPPLDCAEKHKDSLTPGSRIKGMPDGAEKHKGSHLGVATRSRRITFLENKVSFPNAIQDLTIPPNDLNTINQVYACAFLLAYVCPEIKFRKCTSDKKSLTG